MSEYIHTCLCVYVCVGGLSPLLPLSGFIIVLFSMHSFSAKGDTFSSSPSSTPRGSMESLSSHSSEQNSHSKAGSPSHPKSAKPSGALCWSSSASQVSNGPKSAPAAAFTSSPDSSSKEDGAAKTDGEAEGEADGLSVSSLTPVVGRRSPTPEVPRRPQASTAGGEHRTANRSLSTSSSLTSLHISEGKMREAGMLPACDPFHSMWKIKQRHSCKH